MKTDLFQSCGHCWVFQICWHIECSTFTASFRIAGILSPPLALLVVMLSKAHLTLHSWMSGSRQVSEWWTFRFQAGFRKGRGSRRQILNIRWIVEKVREYQKNIYFCFINYPKAFDCVDNKNKMWRILQEMGIPDHLTCLLRNLYAGQEATVITVRMEQQIGCKLGKNYIKAVYCHPAYLTYMQSISWEMSGWIKHKLESRLQGEIAISSGMQMTPLLW